MLLFDFDGVLMDSLDEVVVNTFGIVTDSLCLSLDEVPAIYAELFRKYRYMVQPAGDFIPFAKWCLECLNAGERRKLTTDDFRAMVSAESEPLKIRSRRFFDMRTQRIARDREQWISLHRPYEAIWGTLSTKKPESVLVLTNKNREAVLLLGNYYGIDFVSENIYAAEGGLSKLDNFALIEKRFGPRLYTFVDDSVLNLLEMKRALTAEQMTLVLATWGYVGPEDRVNAEEHEIPAWKQGQLIALINSHLS